MAGRRWDKTMRSGGGLGDGGALDWPLIASCERCTCSAGRDGMAYDYD